MAKTFFDSLNKQLATLDQLREMDRDLRFRPSSPQGARTLTAAQIEGFNQDGFIMPVRAFDRDQVLEERRYFDHLLEETLAEGSDSYSVVDPHMSDARVYDLMFEPCFVEPVRDLIGDDIVCWTTHYLCKMPGEDQQITWHQDAFYWPLTPSKPVSIWLAIDDVDRENGCMQFASGSHRYGPIEHRLSRNDEKNVLRFTVDDIESHGGVVDVELSAGHFSMHSDLLLHGSGPNPSDRRRCGMIFRYAAADVRSLLDWEKTGVLISGQDRTGRWANPPRPVG